MTAQSALHLLCDKYLGGNFASDAVQWAVQELIEGRDTLTLRRLAALQQPAEWFEVEPLLRQTFAELGYRYLEEEECYWAAVFDAAQSIDSGEVSAEDGWSRIYRLSVALDHPSGLRPWLYLGDDLDPDSLDDLRGEAFAAAVIRHARRLLADQA